MSKIFKKALLGFDVAQVIAYIDALTEKQKALLAAERDKYTKQSHEHEEQVVKCRSYALELQQAKDKIEELEAREAEHLQAIEGGKAAQGEAAKRLESTQAMLRETMAIKQENAKLKAQLVQLELEVKRRKPPVVAKITKDESTQLVKKKEEVWESFKERVEEVAHELSQLAEEVKDSEIYERKTSKIMSIKDILDKVRRIGERL